MPQNKKPHNVDKLAKKLASLYLYSLDLTSKSENNSVNNIVRSMLRQFKSKSSETFAQKYKKCVPSAITLINNGLKQEGGIIYLDNVNLGYGDIRVKFKYLKNTRKLDYTLFVRDYGEGSHTAAFKKYSDALLDILDITGLDTKSVVYELFRFAAKTVGHKEALDPNDGKGHDLIMKCFGDLVRKNSKEMRARELRHTLSSVTSHSCCGVWGYTFRHWSLP